MSNTATNIQKLFRVSHQGESHVVPADKAMAKCEELMAKYPNTGVPKFEEVGAEPPPAPKSAPKDFIQRLEDANAKKRVKVGEVQPEEKVRIEAMHDKLREAGVEFDTSEQFYATGTRMMREGHENQARRQAEHDKALPFREAVDALCQRVLSEKRQDQEVSAGEFGHSVCVTDAGPNRGKITAFGLQISEQAVVGLFGRIESPGRTYVMGLRERIVEEVRNAEKAKQAGDRPTFDRHIANIRADRSEVAHVIQHECERNPDKRIVLRTRQALKDIYAVVSPDYGAADAPELCEQVCDGVHDGAKGTWSYDPATTSWELRASVWTPTPVAKQHVGEPFEGYASFRSADNGTGRFWGSGGVLFIRCVNASTYSSKGSNGSRVHRGTKVLVDIESMMSSATKAIDTLCEIWGKNRKVNVEVPKGVTLEQAIPGFWRYLLRDRKSELAGVLPGSSKANGQALTKAFYSERRHPDAVRRSDFAQAWTKMIQTQPAHVRREAELAAGRWLESQSPMVCELE